VNNEGKAAQRIAMYLHGKKSPKEGIGGPKILTGKSMVKTLDGIHGFA
jgi:hypothetical protein